MSPLVVDAPVAATRLLDDESDPRAEAALALLEQVPGVVPQLWHFEMRNILLVAWRRGRISGQGLAARRGLSFYAGPYLEAARRLAGTLTTLDQALARMARAEGLAVRG